VTAPKIKKQEQLRKSPIRRRVFSHDNGSFSNKIVSEEGSGSFLSVVAPVNNDPLESFSLLESGDEGMSYDLSVYAGDGVWDRYIVGAKAEGLDGALRQAKAMNRAIDPIYKIFLCAALVTAFRESDASKHIEELQASRMIPNDTWAKPVAMVGSIAPEYFSMWPDLVANAKGVYHIYDNQAGKFYSFRVEAVKVVYEGFGGLVKRLYAIDEVGKIIMKDGKALAKRGGSELQKQVTAMIDAGGRTTDIVLLRGKQILRARSEDFGLHSFIEAAIADIMVTPSVMGKLTRKPKRGEVYNALLEAMRTAGKVVKKPLAVPQKVELTAKRGEKVDITPMVRRQMNMMVAQFFEIYDNVLESGQGVEALIWGGGVSRVLEPFIKQALTDEDGKTTALHVNEQWVGDKYAEAYMANAEGAFAWGAREFERELGDA
jgi:hypothetical protein